MPKTVHIYRSKAREDRPPEDTALSEWLKAHGVSAFELARRVGCDPKMVRLWASGQSLINIVNAFKVEQATGGGVPVASWLGTSIAKHAWNNTGVDWDRLDQQRTNERKRRRHG